MAWTTLDLLSAIKNTQMLPDASSGSMSPPVLLQFATEVLQLQIVSMILSAREKYYETYTDYAYSTAYASIPVPIRAVAGTISSAQFLYGFDIVPLSVIDPSTVSTTLTAQRPRAIYFQNNSIIPYPSPVSTFGTLRLRWFQRPNRLEQVSNCAQITAVNPLTGIVTCTPPSAWSTSNVFDFIPQNASQATPYGLNSVVSAISSTSMTFSSLPALAAVGDWIALAEYTPIPEIPFEFQTLLSQMTAKRALLATNDQIGLANATAAIAETASSAIQMITPRDQSGSKKVISGWRNF